VGLGGGFVFGQRVRVGLPAETDAEGEGEGDDGRWAQVLVLMCLQAGSSRRGAGSIIVVNTGR
jgi:hypothetical protein